MSTVNLLIKGKVQGVYFRNTAKEEADTCGITGCVKYINEGRVEIMATDEDEKLQQFISWCRKKPEKAVVENVIVTPLSEETFTETTFKPYYAFVIYRCKYFLHASV